jgi:hypothetical protein
MIRRLHEEMGIPAELLIAPVQPARPARTGQAAAPSRLRQAAKPAARSARPRARRQAAVKA